MQLQACRSKGKRDPPQHSLVVQLQDAQIGHCIAGAAALGLQASFCRWTEQYCQGHGIRDGDGWEGGLREASSSSTSSALVHFRTRQQHAVPPLPCKLNCTARHAAVREQQPAQATECGTSRPLSLRGHMEGSAPALGMYLHVAGPGSCLPQLHTRFS